MDGSSDWVASDRTGTIDEPLNPIIGKLAWNGGWTQTHALLAGSPAIGAGNSALAGTVSQNDITRGTSVDIGSYQTVAGVDTTWRTKSNRRKNIMCLPKHQEPPLFETTKTQNTSETPFTDTWPKLPSVGYIPKLTGVQIDGSEFQRNHGGLLTYVKPSQYGSNSIGEFWCAYDTPQGIEQTDGETLQRLIFSNGDYLSKNSAMNHWDCYCRDASNPVRYIVDPNRQSSYLQLDQNNGVLTIVYSQGWHAGQTHIYRPSNTKTIKLPSGIIEHYDVTGTNKIMEIYSKPRLVLQTIEENSNARVNGNPITKTWKIARKNLSSMLLDFVRNGMFNG